MIFDAKHEMIRKLVRQFAETELTTEILDKVEETGEFPEEIVEKMAKCGFLGLKIPREYGGAGADTLAYIIMIEEIARVSAVASLYANTPNSLGGGPLMQAGTSLLGGATQVASSWFQMKQAGAWGNNKPAPAEDRSDYSPVWKPVSWS